MQPAAMTDLTTGSTDLVLADRPIADAAGDLLDRGSFANGLASTLSRPEAVVDGAIVGGSATGYVVGLTGEWGSGKSSILNLVAGKLDAALGSRAMCRGVAWECAMHRCRESCAVVPRSRGLTALRR